MNKNYFYSKNILTIGGYTKINKYLMNHLGLAEAILIETLSSQTKYFKDKGTLRSDGYFYTTYDYLVEYTGLRKFQVVAAFKHLNKLKITDIERTVYKGKRVNYYRINHDKLDQFYTHKDKTVSEHTEGENSYLLYNKLLAQRLSPLAAVIFDDLMTSYISACEWNSLIDDEYFSCIQTKLAKKCQVTPKTICQTYLPQLKDAGLVELKQYGFPKSTVIKINFDKYFEFMNISNNNQSIYIVQESEPERITKLIIQKANKLDSHINWEFSYGLVSYIEDRIKEGYTEDQFIQILEHMYNYYKEQDKLEKGMKFENLFTASKVKQWLKKIDVDNKKEELSLEAETTTATLFNKIAELTQSKTWDITDQKIRSIKNLLDCGITEEELLDHVISRFEFLKAGNYSMRSFNFKKLFEDNTFESIQAQRRKEYDKYKSTTQKGGRETGNGNSRDSAKSVSLTEEERSRAVEMAELYEASGEIGYF